VQIQNLRKEKDEKREIDRRLYERSEPDPVLGHQVNEVGEKLWKTSELYQLILTKDEVWGVREDRRGNLLNVEKEDTKDTRDGAPLPGPKRVNFGLDTQEDRQLLFADLPSIKLDDRLRNAMDPTMASEEELANLSEDMQQVEELELSHVDILSRVLDLKNASGKGIQVENTRRIIAKFGARAEGDERGPDTGSVECQGEILLCK
jgi:small subunit ribosomal protein S15